MCVLIHVYIILPMYVYIYIYHNSLKHVGFLLAYRDQNVRSLLFNVHNERPGVIIDPWVDPDLVISTEKYLLWPLVGGKKAN